MSTFASIYVGKIKFCLPDLLFGQKKKRFQHATILIYVIEKSFICTDTSMAVSNELFVAYNHLSVAGETLL